MKAMIQGNKVFIDKYEIELSRTVDILDDKRGQYNEVKLGIVTLFFENAGPRTYEYINDNRYVSFDNVAGVETDYNIYEEAIDSDKGI